MLYKLCKNSYLNRIYFASSISNYYFVITRGTPNRQPTRLLFYRFSLPPVELLENYCKENRIDAMMPRWIGLAIGGEIASKIKCVCVCNCCLLLCRSHQCQFRYSYMRNGGRWFHGGLVLVVRLVRTGAKLVVCVCVNICGHSHWGCPMTR